MKNQLITTTFILVLALVACKRTQWNTESENRINLVSPLKANHDSIVKTFVENFTPDTLSPRKVHFPIHLIKSVKLLQKESPSSLERYLTLLYLKILKGHLHCCHQTFEIRSNVIDKVVIDSISDPILYQYNLITKQFSTETEMISSGFVEKYIDNIPELLKYNKILEINDEIEQIDNKIKNEIYWK